MDFRRPGPGEGSVRWVNGVLGALNLVLCGMVLYLHEGPWAALKRRLEERGVELPGWLPTLFAAGSLALTVFLAWRGIRHLIRAFRPQSGR